MNQPESAKPVLVTWATRYVGGRPVPATILRAAMIWVQAAPHLRSCAIWWTDYASGTILECGYRIVLEANPEEVGQPIVKIGGATGWYFGNYLWQLRDWVAWVIGAVDAIPRVASR
ncbi:MAG: hypothetical protein JRI50_04785 [Deltaproteobacteria bacterium]|nr:hypothetical protein [Deltaproteobacteria bacterium]